MAAGSGQLAQSASASGGTPPAIQSGQYNIGAVVLAAGEAQRLGGQPKPLLLVDGQPLIRRLTDALAEAGVDRTVVVTGRWTAQIEAALTSGPPCCVHNADYASGQRSSLRTGLAALPAPRDAIIIALADQPLLTAADIASLLHAFANRGDADVVRPRAPGRLGNPIVLTPSLRHAVLNGPPDMGVRHWMKHHPARVAYLETACEHYFADIDTPEDLHRLRLQSGRDLRLPGDTCLA